MRASARRLVSPGALVRLDAALIERIRRGDDLAPVIASAILAIALGAGAYGVAFGLWRAPEQALYSAIKLPLLLLATTACTIALSAMLAMLLRARLSIAQTTVCIVLSLAITSVLLGAVAPIAIFVDLLAPPPDPRALGLGEHDPRALPSMRVAQGLLLVHVFALACAGTTGVARLRALLARLGLPRPIAARVMVAWIGLQFLAGAQLSWLLRPFTGRPHLPPSFTIDGVLEGSFHEELWVLARATFGDAAPLAGAVAVALLVLLLARSLGESEETVTARRVENGLVVPGARERMIPWAAIARATARRAEVLLELHADATLVRETLTIACADPRAARELASAIARERARPRAGPFRTAAPA